MKRWSSTRPEAGLAILRVVLGGIFALHGAQKLFGGIEGTAGMFGAIGIPLPLAAAWLVGTVELLGGIALIAGFGARIAAALLVPTMGVAIATVHWGSGFSNVNITGMSEQGPLFGMPGWEFNLALIGGLLGVLVGGAGRLRALSDPGAAGESPTASPRLRRAA